MSKATKKKALKKKPMKRRFSQEDVDEAREQGKSGGEKNGFKEGYRCAKLEAFAICAREKKAFVVHPEVLTHVLPLVEKALEKYGIAHGVKDVQALVVALDTKTGGWTRWTRWTP